MPPIKSRKHALGLTAGASRLTPTASLTAALFTGLALGASLPVHAQAAGGPSTEDPDPQRKTTTLDKVEVHGEHGRQYSGEVSSPKFTQPLVDTTQTVNVIGADLFVCSASGLVVTDFNESEGDRIGLPGGATWSATDVAGGTRLVATFGAGSSRFMTLTGITADQVQSSWFITAV